MKSFVILHNEGRYYHHALQSDTISEKLQEVYNIEVVGKGEIEIYKVHISEELIFPWSSVIAHYCFGKGRIPEDNFIEACNFAKPSTSSMYEVSVELDYHSDTPEGIQWLSYEPKIEVWLPGDNFVFDFKCDSNLITLFLTAPDMHKAIEYAENRIFAKKIVADVEVCTIRAALEFSPFKIADERILEKGGEV